VFDEPGTTRDVVTVTTAIDGWPVELADTAGLRNSADELEALGIARARKQMAAADVLLLVFDATQSWTSEDAELVAQWPKAIVIFNKCDLAQRSTDTEPGVFTSAVTRQGIDELIRRLGQRLVPNPPPPGSAVPFTTGQLRVIENLVKTEDR
jgi:tRNA modification GTPase